jgi:MFS family permease
MMTLFRQRNFALLWWGQLISALGDWGLFVALPFYVYDRTGSTLATGGMFIAQTVPGVLFGSLAGVFVDRWDRKRTMIVADVARALLLLPLLLIAHAPAWVWLVYPAGFGERLISLFFFPAKDALLPRLAPQRHLMAANALNAVSDNLARLMGPPIGGALLGLAGLGMVVLVDSTSYLLSSVMIGLIALSTDRAVERRVQTARPPSRWADLWHEWLAGLRLVRRDPGIMALFLVNGIVMLGEGIPNVLLVVFIKDVLHGGGLEFGWLMTVRGLASIVGGLIAGYASKRLAPPRLIVLGAVATGMVLLATFNSATLPIVLIWFALSGVAWIPYAVSLKTLLQSGVADRFRGRVFGAFDTTSALLLLGGAGLASVLGEVLGIVLMLNVFGALYLVAGVVALVTLQRGFGAGVPVPAGEQGID